MPDCDVSTWRRKGTHTFLDSFHLADALSMLDTIVTFQDGAEKVHTLFSIRSACRSRRAKHAGYYCDVSRWRRKGTHTFLDTFRLADKIRRRLLRRRNYRVTTVTTVCVLGTADNCLDILPFVDWACSHMVTGHQICTKKKTMNYQL